MILNNTHVQGIFMYKSDIEYEKGDFVVSGNSIYICTAGNPTNTENNTVMGKDPAEDSENYTIYLGDSLDSIEEYFSYIEDPNPEKNDKVLTAQLLSEILNTYMIGFDEKGIIGEYVYSDGGGISVSSGLSKFLDGTEDSAVLDNILKIGSINNATFKVSRSLEQIKDIFPVLYKEGSISPEDLEYLILRQYTYTNGTDPNSVDSSLYRVQELVDPVQGLTAYRYAKGVGNNESGDQFDWEITSWKTDYDPDFLQSINKLEEAYRQAIEDLKKEKENLRNYFRFKEFEILKTTGEVTLQCDDPDGDFYIPVESFTTQSCVITVIAQLWNTNTTISIDILDSHMDISNILTYYLTDSSSLTVEPFQKEEFGKKVKVRVNNGNITNIYYRENYK